MSKSKKRKPSSTGIKGMTPFQLVHLAGKLHVAMFIRVMYTCYGWREKRIKDFLEMYLVLFEEFADGRTTIKQQVRDCYELTGFDPDELLNEVIQERFNSNLNDN